MPNGTLIASYLYLVNFFGMASAFALIFYLPLYLQAVLELAALWMFISVFNDLTSSFDSGLIMQATGKYYLLTTISYFASLLGTIVVNLSTGITVSSTIGMAVSKYFPSL